MNSLYYIFFNAKKGLAILRIIGCCLGFFQDQKDLVYRKGLYRLGKKYIWLLKRIDTTNKAKNTKGLKD